MGYADNLQADDARARSSRLIPSFPQNGAPTLAITGYDKSHRMRHNTPERFTFKHVNDRSSPPRSPPRTC